MFAFEDEHSSNSRYIKRPVRTRLGKNMLGAKTGDERVRALLEELGMKYDVSSSGAFQVLVQFDDDRSQSVYIASQTYYVDKLEVREVSSAALDSDAPFHADVANALLIHNNEVPIGAWRLHRHDDDDGCTAIFSIQIAATTTASTLRTAIHEAARAADFVEERFTGQDEF